MRRGEISELKDLLDTVFQGTVLGPALWNTFFDDISRVVASADLVELLFADDLNCFKTFANETPNEDILSHLRNGQKLCHDWGDMNQVEFEATKESFTILSKHDAFGDIFKLLGVLFDTQLTMLPMINHLVTKMGNKLKALFRVRKFYSLS